MQRRYSVLWIPLLAALIGVPLVESPRGIWSGETVPGLLDSAAPAFSYALPIARSQPPLTPRSPLDRQGVPFWSALAAAAATFSPRILTAPSELDSDPLASATGHYPLFPTGPPSQS